MRIGLNLLHAQPDIGGGWQYIENLVGAIADYDTRNEYVAFVTSSSRRLIPKGSKFVEVPVSINAQSRPQRVLFENSILQFYIKKYDLDLVHWFANTKSVVSTVPSAVTVYDLGLYHQTTEFSAAKRAYLRLFLPLTFRRASMLLPMSEATAADLHMLFRIEPSRMVVIPPVLNQSYVPADCDAAAGFGKRIGLPEKFWLYVAHLYPHKNHVRLLQAYSLMKARAFKPWPLIFRGDPHGSESLVRDTIRDYGLQDDVRFIPRLDIDEMPLLYSNAGALVFPSLFEGGGMPVAEAMACGCPVVASDIPSVREFAGPAALYFNPREPEAIAAAMLRFQRDLGLRESLSRAGLDQANSLRAESIASRLIEAYKRGIKTGKRRAQRPDNDHSKKA